MKSSHLVLYGVLVSWAVDNTVWAFSLSNSKGHVNQNTDNDLLPTLVAQVMAWEEGPAATALTSFYEPSLYSFSVQPGTSERLSVTSTCYALQAICLATESPEPYESLFALDVRIQQPTTNDNTNTRTPVRRILQALLESQWREDDLFQVPLLLYTLLQVDPERNWWRSLDETAAARIRKLMEAVLVARPRRRDGLRQAYSDYIWFQCAKVYAVLYQSSSSSTMKPSSSADGEFIHDFIDSDTSLNDPAMEEVSFETSSATIGTGIPPAAVPEGITSSVALALLRCAETSYNTLTRQLALRAADADFDVMSLAYALLSYIITTEELVKTAGREVIPGQGPTSDSRVRPVNRKLVQAGLAAFMDAQQADGMWPQGQPIYRSFRKTGRNIGNAFIFAVDTMASLLEHLPAEDFRPYLPHLQRLLNWIQTNHGVEILPDYCDVETGQCYGKTIQGWTSPHLTADVGPQGWSTAQTCACLARLRTTLETLLHQDVLAEFRGMALSDQGLVTTAWNRLLDTDLGTCGTDHPCTLKQVLEERMILPRLGEEASVLAESYSAVLFGPPGSAKTTIGQALAERIGYDFLVIDTSEFLADGLTSVASRIRYVFSRLQALRRCVILFDEIEEFCLDRETPGIGMESRMLTTAMLTAINDLRRAKKSIFFVATNRLRAFDAAIIRPGRFDMQLFVGTPNLEARSIQFQQKLADLSLDSATKQHALEEYASFLASVWDEDAKYMNYIEGVKFASACANLLARSGGGSLTTESMARILDSQTSVMTVRGQVREEFDASMGLTRL